jgi:acyl transferase domain-containing protein
VPTLQRDEHDWDALLETLARLYASGSRINWTALEPGRTVRPIRLPTHPVQRTRCWYDGPSVAAANGPSQPSPRAAHPLLGERLRLPGSAEIRFETRFTRQAPQFLEDHRLFGVSLPPAASHLSMLAQAAISLSASTPAHSNAFRFAALHLVRPLLLPEGVQRDVQLILRPVLQGWSVELTSAETRGGSESPSEWTTHMIGEAAEVPAVDQSAAATPWNLDEIRTRCPRQTTGTEFYTRIWANQGGTGSSFRWIDSIWQGDKEALCLAACPAGILDYSGYRLHPGLIEAACQVLHCCGEIETADQLEAIGVTYIPFSIDAFLLTGVPATHAEAWCHARLHELTPENVVADLTILTSSGQVVAILEGFCLRPITRDAVVRTTAAPRPHDGDDRKDWLPGRENAPARDVPEVPEMVRYLKQKCAELFGRVEADVPTDVGFTALGLDSLAAMRLSNHLLSDFGFTVSLRQILTCSGIESLAVILSDGGKLDPEAGHAAPQRIGRMGRV